MAAAKEEATERKKEEHTHTQQLKSELDKKAAQEKNLNFSSWFPFSK